MSKYYCNPVNYSYKYQFIGSRNRQNGQYEIVAAREGADPSLICFKGKYLLFPSMTCGFLYSDDLVTWNFHPHRDLPKYDYAPDVRVNGDYLYFCASSHEHGTFYRTKDPFSDEYEKLDGDFPFWDPNEFFDEDGRMYLYYGSDTETPIHGAELDPKTCKAVSETADLVFPDVENRGFERNGENHKKTMSDEMIAGAIKQIMASGMSESQKHDAINYISQKAYLEGAWVNKHRDTYYLQVAETSSGHNIYSDIVYTSKNPLGPFTLAENGLYSYKPGGFIPGAGHGSTMEDLQGNLWHIATQRITVNQNFERRVGLWPAGYDKDGDLFCNQRYGDWPIEVSGGLQDPWKDPVWMLLSYGAKTEVSSAADGKGGENAVDENIRTWWRAGSNEPGEWLKVDLGEECEVHAVQINFADDKLMPGLPEGIELQNDSNQARWIDEIPQKTRWMLEASSDGENWFTIEDKSGVDTDLPHDLIVREEGFCARFLKLTVCELPYHQEACVSGLRVFGLDRNEQLPEAASEVCAQMDGDLDMDVNWKGHGATGYVVEWGYAPEKLYHSYQVFENHVHIAALTKGQPVYVRVDSWNRAGITEGKEVVKCN